VAGRCNGKGELSFFGSYLRSFVKIFASQENEELCTWRRRGIGSAAANERSVEQSSKRFSRCLFAWAGFLDGFFGGSG
jgi:hypothetical protein